MPGTCDTCAFYLDLNLEPDVGECRRHPPRVQVWGPGQPEIERRSGSTEVLHNPGLWPEVFDHDWCGEYSPA